MSQTRIYTIARGNACTLVRAGSQAQALRHVAQREFSIRVATQGDLVAHLTAGGKVQEAGVDSAEPEAAQS